MDVRLTLEDIDTGIDQIEGEILYLHLSPSLWHLLRKHLATNDTSSYRGIQIVLEKDFTPSQALLLYRSENTKLSSYISRVTGDLVIHKDLEPPETNAS